MLTNNFRSVPPNGYLVLKFAGRTHTVIGGSFDAFAGGFGVCLEPHSSKADKADILASVPDFGVPPVSEFEKLLASIVKQMLHHPDVPVFVGCRAGIGRTGMVLAGLARAVGECDRNAVTWVRQHYLPHAVETDAQTKLVVQFNRAPIQKMIADYLKPASFSDRLRFFFTGQPTS